MSENLGEFMSLCVFIVIVPVMVTTRKSSDFCCCRTTFSEIYESGGETYASSPSFAKCIFLKIKCQLYTAEESSYIISLPRP